MDRSGSSIFLSGMINGPFCRPLHALRVFKGTKPWWMDQCSSPGKQLFWLKKKKKRYANDNWGTAVTWRVGLWGTPPQRGPSDVARITIRGKIKWPWLPLSLNYTCKPPLYRPAAAPQKKPECSFVLATGRCFDCLLAVSPDNHRAQKQIPLA